MANPLMTGFNQGVDPSDQWNKLTPDDARGPLTIDPQGAALARQFYAIRDSIAGDQAPIWNQNNPVGTETLQSVGMPQPTTYAGPVGQFIDPATGRMTTQGMARMDNPAMGFDTGGIGGMAEHFISYHGSPHDFPPLPGKPYGAFSDAAIGSGEGAQAYGMGHYTADAEGLARRYRDDVTASKGGGLDYLDATGQRTNYGDLYGRAYDAVSKMEGAVPDIKRAIPRQVLDAVEGGTAPENYMAEYDVDPRYAAHYQAAADALTGVQHSPNKGHMYEVKINADPAHFLDWDKPLSEQHPKVQDAINGLADNSVALSQRMAEAQKNNIPLTGNDVVSTLARAGNFGDPRIAAALQAAGIPGIRYLDAGSRGAGEGSRNSVVFDPATMEIIRKYGLAGLMAGGGAAALSGQQGQEQ